MNLIVQRHPKVFIYHWPTVIFLELSSKMLSYSILNWSINR